MSFLFALKGREGDKGDTGDKGDEGDKGDKGDTGEAGQCTHVSSGNINAWDFSPGDFIKDSNWHSLSLADIIPVGTKIVAIRYYINATVAPKVFRLRNHDHTNGYNIDGVSCNVAGRIEEGTFYVEPDSDRVIDYFAATATWPNLSLVIRGWVLQ